MKFCEYCGKQVLGEVTTCSGCGATVEQKPEKTQVASNFKYCVHCGNQILSEAVMCPKCGSSAGKNKRNISNGDKSRVLKLAVKIFMLIAVGSCIANGVGALLTSTWVVLGAGHFVVSHVIFSSLIPLVWIIPMTIHYFKATKNNQPVGTGFKVCTLIFVNFIAGILMFCDASLNNSKSDTSKN